MSDTRSRAPLIVTALAGVIALAAGLWASTTLFAPATLDTDSLHGTYLNGGRDITEFQLIDHHGEPFTRDQLEGGWTLLFFGFTNCPDICPMTMLELGQVRRLLADEGVPDVDRVRGVFVTVDPARDTPERLQQYVPSFDPQFVGVTGALSDIDVLARDLGIVHMRHDEEDDEDYMVDHGSAVLLINPDGRLQALFQAPHRARQISSDMAQILAHHGRI
ncbi:protein SCO1/2 [Natronocella acetinitrilica]|uniref:Protein SCO1/2 n=1 Tax=Natronocella acetinitrilica TaxID=414046 RepID=A0AAE3KA37_9GAMM|nr:SCO family protein [Natronocella acetinitrilica]MCP1673730.1 protein SCO1/2 [Natronocella acetinitrilica]